MPRYGPRMRSTMPLLVLFVALLPGCGSPSATPSLDEAGESSALRSSLAAPPGWSTTGSFARRLAPSAVLLPSGKVLVVGGLLETYSTTAALYDPATGTWSPTGSLATARALPSVSLLPDGRVLVAGGGPPPSFTAVASAELYDPVSGTWSPTDSLLTPRLGHTAVRLPSGKVLVVGGMTKLSSSVRLASAELYDPRTGVWTAAASMATARWRPVATLLKTGKVLVIGGAAPGDAASTSAELYDPDADRWTPTGGLSVYREYDYSVTLLDSGKVLVVGGKNKVSLASTELYDPASGTWSTGEPLARSRDAHTATLLPSGKVLVAGGNSCRSDSDTTNSCQVLSETALYHPETGKWTQGPQAALRRSEAVAVRLDSGVVLVAGGYHTDDVAPAELYAERGPAASTQALQTRQGSRLEVRLEAGDPDGDSLTYTLVEPPQHGTLAGTPPVLTYTPTSDFVGTDTLRFKVSDGLLESEVATVSIEVQPAPPQPEERGGPCAAAGADPSGLGLCLAVLAGLAHRRRPARGTRPKPS
ncbi:kelch repeat-containing protein [Cystobacter fuscus]|uniref:Kelch repeat-containing protein n=1 Tax=Cystobacter fuscus TaxID=43 RepID=UPI002B2F73CD|nr:hypothetical protein F0U63_30590 [Cystobacter fuscus]